MIKTIKNFDKLDKIIESKKKNWIFEVECIHYERSHLNGDIIEYVI